MPNARSTTCTLMARHKRFAAGLWALCAAA